MTSIIEEVEPKYRDLIIKTSIPEWIEPMLATLTSKRFSDENWIYERKLDGERCLAFKINGRVKLLSRNRKDISNTYPEIVDALEKQKTPDLIIDGEIVAFQGDNTSFSKLQERIGIKNREEALKSKIKVYYYIFDLIYIENYLIEKLPLIVRKELLKKHLTYQDPLRYTEHIWKEGVKYYQEACRKGWEGVIAKRAASEYQHKRSTDWLKFKCVNEQEFIIIGYTPPKGSRIGLGSILVGYYDKEKIVYAGKVGTGFNRKLLTDLKRELEAIKQETPLTEDKIGEKNVTWVKPEIVVQVGFTEWTKIGKLRHPRLLGVRRDKDPRTVVKETPEA
ncbi:MAG: non-homologous end-joining DNA ligase [Candidatus Odinarchaeum yellowstonii]|uniref:Non-homologous end-joining DNA ligase n=1 Tax=Odinarchaeota yellowstonii (strain LCB_4) TaxID=1841599 RepID=A0AAF0D1T3_ODILC|nr:MAG: non-homologous end-joining DNA ligase [Candidatus Odinarchaeum yellowstonii]